MDLKQGDEVIGQVYDLSAQQLIILLSIYIGCAKNIANANFMLNWIEDVRFLDSLGLIKWASERVDPELRLTDTAHKYINNILTITVMKEVKETIKIEPKKD